jgi:hypothetical protein
MKTSHVLRGHASLAPSASKRWIKCPRSVARSAGEHSKSSIWAKEGSAAHELCEVVMTKDHDPYDYLNGVVVMADRDGKKVDFTPGVYKRRETNAEPDNDNIWPITDEMCESVEMYRSSIKERIEPGDVVMFETKLDMTHIHPNFWGTGDCMIYKPKKRHLVSLDFKYGSGIAVEAEENEQALSYSVGGVKQFNYEVDTLEIVIVQPRAYHRLGPVRTYDIDIIDLLFFEEFLRRQAALTDSPDAKVEVGEHCRFCPVAGRCPELREFAIKAIKARRLKGRLKVAALEHMNARQLGEVFKDAKIVEIWVRRFFEYAHDQALQGTPPEGTKMVEGRAYRKWVDKAEAELNLTMLGYDPEEYMYQPEIKYPGTVEKVVGRKVFREHFAELTIKPVGKPVLAFDDDDRNAISVDPSGGFSAVEDDDDDRPVTQRKHGKPVAKAKRNKAGYAVEDEI